MKNNKNSSKIFASTPWNLITAIELKEIRKNSAWCAKTTFYKEGSISLIQSPDTHQEICGS